MRVVLLSAEDVEAFLKRPVCRDGDRFDIVTLSPAARAVACRAGLACKHSGDVFGSTGHAIAAVQSRRAFEELRDSMVARGLPDELIVSMSFVYFTWCAISVRVWRSLGCSPRWLVPSSSGVVEVATREQAHDHIMRAILVSEMKRWPVRLPVVRFPYVFRSIRNLLLRCARLGNNFVATPTFKMRFGFKSNMNRGKAPLFAAVFWPSEHPWRDLVAIVAWLTRKSKGGSLQVPTTVRPEAEKRVAEFDSVLSGLKNPVGRRVLKAFKSEFMTISRFVVGYGEDVSEPMAALAPRWAIVHEANTPHGAILAAGAKRASIPVMNTNNNSLPPQTSRIASLVMQTVAESRISGRLSDVYVAWSPLTARSVKRQSHPPKIVAGREEQPPWVAPVDKFRILYASNSPDWFQFYPYVIETSDEFSNALVGFIEAIKEFDRLETNVRLRNKSEINPELLERMSGLGKAVRISDVTAPFLNALATSDLLVSFMSSTIEQALQMRIPVLLWGPTKRHTHLPAMSSPPRGSKRSAIYVAHDAEHLRKMLPAIRRAHKGIPLSDDELCGLVWPAHTRHINDVAAGLMSNGRVDLANGVAL